MISKFFKKHRGAMIAGIIFSAFTILSIVGSAQAAENTTLNFVVQSTNIQTSTVALSSSQQLPEFYNITLLEHNTSESIKSFVLSTASQSEEVPLGRYDVFIVQGTEEVIFDNNGSGYMAGDTVILPLYCDPSLVTCQLEDKYYLDIPWRVEPNVNIPIFGIINTPTSIWSVSIYDTKHTGDTSDDTLLDQKVFSPSLSITSSDLPYTFEFSVNPSAVTIINGNASIRIVFRVDDIIDYDNDEGPLEFLISTSNLPKLSNWYSGDTHYHSSYTNNEVEFGGKIENTVDAGKAIGLDWVTITDHSFDLDTDTEWDNLVSDANSNSSNNFIAIASEEISCDNPGPGNYNHYLGYGISNRIFSGEVPDDTGTPLQCLEVVQQVNSQGGFGYIAHPFAKEGWGITYRNVWQDYSLDFKGLEVWNGKTDEGLWGGYTSWKELLSDGIDKWVELLINHRHVFIEGGSDAHGDFNNFGTVRTVVNVPSLGRDNILIALRNGHSIMTDGPVVVFDITNETGKKAIIGDTINGSQFSLNMQWKSTPEFGNVNRIYVHRGVIGDDETELSALGIAPNNLEGTRTFTIQDYLPSNKDSYIRINATTDKGYRAYTNPIWINKSSTGRSSPPDSFGYTFKDSNTPGGPTYDWIEISGTGTEVLPNSDDAVIDNINIGFFFNYYGTDYSRLAIANNGLLFSSGTTWQFVNEPITQSPSVHGFIAPFWDDIVTYGDAGTIYYQTTGTSPNRMFIVEWYDNKHYWNSNSGVTFEAILYESSNNIKFQYRDVDFGNVYRAVSGDNPPYNNGGSSTVGIEAPSGDIGLQYSFNEPVITPELAILFRFPQYAGVNLYLSKQAPVSKDRGSTMTYTLYYHNFADTPAQNVVLEDMLPPEVEFVSASDGGSYNSITGKVTWNIGSVAASGNGYRTLMVRIPQSAAIGSVLQNNARISTSNIEVRYDDNEAHASTKVTGSTLPPDVSVEPTNGNTGGTPSVYWGTPTTFTYYSPCATGVGINIHVNDGLPDITGSMVESSPDTWTYTTTFHPRHGATTVTYTTGCSEPSVSFNIYIDPAGYIYDINTGARISGASVWLQHPDGAGGWGNVPTGQTPAIAQPDVNPLITGADGQYQWNVLEGSYRVHVEAPDYYPADSIVVSIPPPVTDLHVGLTRLPDATPPAPVTNLHASRGSTWLNWTWNNPSDSDLDHIEVYLNSAFLTNISAPQNFHNITSLLPDTLYEIGTRTVDTSGNINGSWENAAARTLPIDSTPPIITGTLSTAPNAEGWHNSSVTINWSVNDPETGIYSSSGCEPITLSDETPGTTLTCSATNGAGLSSSQSVTARIDKTPPNISISGVNNGSYYNSNVIPAVTITDTNLDAQSITLNGAPYTNGTVVSAEGRYTLVASATDMAGNSMTKTVNFFIDKTPPEAAIRFDVISKDIKVYDSETGVEAGYAALPSKNNGDEKGWELRQYTLRDSADNTLLLVLKYNNGKKQAEISVISAQYNGGAVIEEVNNRISVKYSEGSSLKQLEQKMEAKNLFDIEAKYKAGKGETEIRSRLEGHKEKKETRAGIVILELLTNNGGFKPRY